MRWQQAGAEGKRLRPTILLLMASTLSAVVPNPHYLTVDERPPNVHPEEVNAKPMCVHSAVNGRKRSQDALQQSSEEADS